MIVGTVEDLAVEPDAVQEEEVLSIRRARRPESRSIAEREGRWVGSLRLISAAKLRYWGIPDLIDDAQVAISELVTNALLHGGERVAFRFLLATNVLALEVDDGSPKRAFVTHAAPDDEHGRGMFIVDELSDECGVSPDGTKTWCAFLIPAAARRTR